MTQFSRIPVVLLTGFLGSGKTTLLNRLMRAKPASWGKLAIVVNELGDVGIDGALLPAGMTRQVELPGGCICCVLNEDLDKTLLEILAATPDLEHIIIETTGVAEPAPIGWSLAREPLAQRVRLATVITVVDTAQWESSRPLSIAVDAQVEYADILVLSKTDLAGEPTAELLATLRELNPSAVLVAGTPEEITAVLWQSIVDPAFPAGSERSQVTTAGDHSEGDHHHQEARSSTAHGFETVWLSIENTIDFEELTAQLEELPANYVRIKGIARVIDASTGSSEPRWIAFHRVGARVSCEPLAAPAESRMVALGSGIERSRLAACLKASVVPCES